MKNVKVVKDRIPGTVVIDMSLMPSYQTDAMCRTVLGAVSRMFEDPAVVADYERWRQEQQQGSGVHNVEGC